MQFQVFKHDFDFERILVSVGQNVFFGTDMDRIEHLYGLRDLTINAVVIGFELMANETG
jgi:hypothetical protein